MEVLNTVSRLERQGTAPNVQIRSVLLGVFGRSRRFKLYDRNNNVDAGKWQEVWSKRRQEPCEINALIGQKLEFDDEATFK